GFLFTLFIASFNCLRTDLLIDLLISNALVVKPDGLLRDVQSWVKPFSVSVQVSDPLVSIFAKDANFLVERVVVQSQLLHKVSLESIRTCDDSKSSSHFFG